MVKGMPRIFTIAACLLYVAAALPGCSFTPANSPPVPAEYGAPHETWKEVYEAIFARSVASAAEAETYARKTMQEWIDTVRERTEADFKPWYCGYWTQQWLDLKAGWYGATHAEGDPTAAERLSSYLRAQYDTRVLEPVKREIDPDKVMDEAASRYVQALREEIQSLRERYHLSPDQLRKRLEQIPAIAPQSDPGQSASLYQILQAGDITQVPAYAALAASIRSQGGIVNVRPLTDKFGRFADRAADKAAGRLALRGAAAAASAALGGVGVLLGMGATLWGAREHSRALPEMEAEVGRQLGSGLDEVWSEMSATFDSTVLGAMRHISSNIDVSLLSHQTD